MLLRDRFGDNGLVGVALALWHRYLGKPRVSAESAGTWERPSLAAGRVPKYTDGMSGSYLGPQYSDEDIAKVLGGNWLRLFKEVWAA